MKNLGITKCLNAKADIGLDEINDNLYQCIVTSNELGFNVAHVFGTTPTECEKNADLVSDTFNTANKTNMLPSELLEQRDELLEMLVEVSNFLPNVQSPKTQSLFLSQSITNLLKQITNEQ